MEKSISTIELKLGERGGRRAAGTKLDLPLPGKGGSAREREGEGKIARIRLRAPLGALGNIRLFRGESRRFDRASRGFRFTATGRFIGSPRLLRASRGILFGFDGPPR